MSKSQVTTGKKDREKRKRQKKDDKQKKMEERKANNSKGKDLEEMMAYTDEYGNLTSVKPDPNKKRTVRMDEILISVPKQEHMKQTDTVRNGTVTFFNSEKGYGFIKDSETGQSVFVHMSALKNPVSENDKVTFQVEKGQRGPNAIDVKKG